MKWIVMYMNYSVRNAWGPFNSEAEANEWLLHHIAMWANPNDPRGFPSSYVVMALYQA